MSNLYAIRSFTCQSCGKFCTGRFAARRKYCSHECFRTAPKPARKTGESYLCALCNKQVYVTKSCLGKEQYFCCREHHNEWQGRNKVTLTCKCCGLPFRRSASKSDRFYCSVKCRDACPEYKVKMLLMVANQQKQAEPNAIEKIGYRLLSELGTNFLPQHPIANKFCVDAFLPEQKLVVQFDGDYWHGNTAKFPILEKRQQNRRSLDATQDAYMKTLGYSVLRLWESELKKSPETAKAKIAAAVALPS